MAKKTTEVKKETSKFAVGLHVAILSFLIGACGFLLWDRFGNQNMMCGVTDLDSSSGIVFMICKR